MAVAVAVAVAVAMAVADERYEQSSDRAWLLYGPSADAQVWTLLSGGVTKKSLAVATIFDRCTALYTVERPRLTPREPTTSSGGVQLIDAHAVQLSCRGVMIIQKY